MIACSKDRIKLTFLLFFITVFVFTSCKKSDNSTIGADFIGARDGFNMRATDSLSLITYSVKHDSLPTVGLASYLLGNMNDPILGSANANIFTQFSVPNNQFTLGGTKIDSVVLRLKYTSAYYGNISTPQQISVYELKEDLILSSDSGYFSNREYKITDGGGPITTAPIGYFYGKAHLTDSIYETINGITYGIDPHLRIKLSDAFVAKMQQAESAGAFLSSDAFKSYMKGLAILAQKPNGSLMPGEGAMVTYNLNYGATVTGLVIYYDGGKQSAQFPITGTEISSNQYKSNTSVPLQPYLNGVQSNECYVEGAAGIKTRILIPHLLELVKNQTVAIVGAELVLSVQDGKDDATYPVPPSLLLLGGDEKGRNVVLLDKAETYPYAPDSYYGGVYDAATRQYKFNIIRHIQNILNTYKASGEDINYGMNLVIPADGGYSRLVLNTNTALKKIKLNLSYTVIK